MFHALFSRLSVATVLTLLVLAASASIQPETALASPGVGPDRGDVVSYLDDDNGNNGNNGNNGDDDNGNNNDDDNGNNGDDDNGNNGGGGTFFNPCVFPWFAPNPACTYGLFGS